MEMLDILIAVIIGVGAGTMLGMFGAPAWACGIAAGAISGYCLGNWKK